MNQENKIKDGAIIVKVRYTNPGRISPGTVEYLLEAGPGKYEQDRSSPAELENRAERIGDLVAKFFECACGDDWTDKEAIDYINSQGEDVKGAPECYQGANVRKTDASNRYFEVSISRPPRDNSHDFSGVF